MRVLAFVDIHGNRTALKRIGELAAGADVLICAGDLTVFEKDSEKLLGILDALAKPVLAIPGNHEATNLISLYSRRYRNIIDIHKRIVRIGDIDVMGFGSGGFSLIDKGFERFASGYMKKKGKLLLVTHAPPYGTLLDMILHEHRGSKSYREFILREKPEFAICGHLHENHGMEDRLGSTCLINPGPFGRMIEI